nr:putative RNA-directed DNA polymerase, eukaryota, reverse transcriptase zinc-binding domain protein [Tanacetum cinerariifolium]
MKTDIFEFVNSFFASGSMPQGANSSFFTLISKISNPLSVKYFCPISLIGTHYNIISKFLANRLSKVIDKVISQEQSAFIVGRQIIDAPSSLARSSSGTKKKKKKILGFGSKWRSWVRACLYSSRASILINGSPTFEFFIKRGLRQGDPLSPFLFILVMEGLHCAMSNAVNSGLIRGIKLVSSGIVLSHLFYEDDVIITTDWNPHDIDNIIRVLHVFHLASGLKINIHKSNIFGIGVTNDEISSMTSWTGCAAGCFPFTYLGLLIGANMNLTSNWQILIDRFQKRLSSWKANLLSIGGRLTLIKEVLGSLGIFYLSIFKAPEIILNSMESLCSRFFWGGSQDSRNMAWCSNNACYVAYHPLCARVAGFCTEVIAFDLFISKASSWTYLALSEFTIKNRIMRVLNLSGSVNSMEDGQNRIKVQLLFLNAGCRKLLALLREDLEYAFEDDLDNVSKWLVWIMGQNRNGLCLNLQKSTKNRTISTQDQKPQDKAGSESSFSSKKSTLKLRLSKNPI